MINVKGITVLDILWQLQTAQARFPAPQSRVARFVLDNLTFTSQASIEQLATKAGVSAETLTAFARSVGCKDLNDFMAQLRALNSKQVDENSVAPAVTGDIDFSTTTALEKLAAKAGIGPDMLKRFARSIGREDFSDILFQIRRRLNELSQQEAKVARAVLEDVDFASSASIEQLATRSGVSPATITRFAKSVGCEDIRELRMKLAQASTSHSRYLPAREATNLPAAWQQTLAGVEQALQTQLQSSDTHAFSLAAACLKKARSVTLFAMGNQDAPFASELQHRLLEAGIMTTLCQESNLMRMTAATLSDDHALLVLTTDEADIMLQAAVLQAREHGLPIVTLAPASSPLAAMSQHLIALPAGQKLARYGVLMAIDLLLAEWQ
ncbi:SIS domain-containing protein [Erwinia sp. QL-Z3]|uniref:MurR/RpiR family transcriptional regulator n=1 Tax=Erwinia sp. QL-Z3 TaxID=2547962 RepID=UPI00352F4EEE